MGCGMWALGGTGPPRGFVSVWMQAPIHSGIACVWHTGKVHAWVLGH